MIAASILILTGVYLISGLLFSIPFALIGVGKIDPHAARGSWGFRLLIIPGSILMWPLLSIRWVKGIHQPPEERTAHRLSAKVRLQSAECTQAQVARFSSHHSQLSTLH
jgi:hypothetical protein